MDKVLCPYCGEEMDLDCGLAVFFTCPKCESTSPYADTPEAALSAAMQRYVEPNRVLTVEECAALDPDGATCVESSRGEIETQLNQEIINETSGMIEMYGLQNAKKLYGKYGRCWLRRPTDEERQSVAWEESQ